MTNRHNAPQNTTENQFTWSQCVPPPIWRLLPNCQVVMWHSPFARTNPRNPVLCGANVHLQTIVGFSASLANGGTTTTEEDSHRHIEPPLGDLYQCDINGALNRVETLAEELAKGGALVWDPTKTTDEQRTYWLRKLLPHDL
jgi:hypothetical protein